MNENKKDLNEILEPENDDKVDVVENFSTVNEDEKNLRKKKAISSKCFDCF